MSKDGAASGLFMMKGDDTSGSGVEVHANMQGSREIVLAVVNEVDNDTLLLHHLTSDNIYKRQEQTLISLKDPEKALDLLLSFQEAKGCLHIWQSITYSQQKLQSGDLGYELNDLPYLELSSLPSLLKTILEWGKKDRTHIAELIFRNVQGMVIDSADEMLYQSCLKILLGSSNTTANNQDVVLQVFFDKHLQNLIDAIASSCAPKGIARSTSGLAGVRTTVEQHSAKPETLLKICELLSFCALHHTNRMKIFFATNAMEKVLTLTHRREKFLVVAAVQFVRTIIGRKDDFLVDRVIKLNLLKPVIKAFDDNGDRDNMLQSVVLELLEYIRKENLKPLIEYVAESFWGQLVKFERLQSIMAFKLKYHLTKSGVPEEIVESAKTKQSNGVVDMRKKKADKRGADNQQEGYFEDSDGVDSSTPTMHSQEQSITARKPVNADEAQVVGNNLDNGRHSPHKKLKPQDRIRSPKSVASAKVACRNSGLKGKEGPPSPSRSTKNSEGSGEGDGSQHAPETLGPVHQKGEDCNEAAGDLSSKMVPRYNKTS